jgi:hypothetical protein
MLFGTMHLMYGTGSAVSRYEKDYPNLTFVISELGVFDTDLPTLSSSRLATWPIPSLALAKGTMARSLDLAGVYCESSSRSPRCAAKFFPAQ